MSSTELQSQVINPSITIRPIRLEDTGMQAEFFRRLSPQAKRFLGGIKELTPDMLKSFCDVDFGRSETV